MEISGCKYEIKPMNSGREECCALAEGAHMTGPDEVFTRFLEMKHFTQYPLDGALVL